MEPVRAMGQKFSPNQSPRESNESRIHNLTLVPSLVWSWVDEADLPPQNISRNEQTHHCTSSVATQHFVAITTGAAKRALAAKRTEICPRIIEAGKNRIMVHRVNIDLFPREEMLLLYIIILWFVRGQTALQEHTQKIEEKIGIIVVANIL
eukprot:scaffold2679_cov140-Amphora_coffeaeformis.AAC.6